MKKYNITVKGVTYEVLVEEVPMGNRGASRSSEPQPADFNSPYSDIASGTLSITAPMPGTVLAIDVKIGQTVKKGDRLCTLEAMKMENSIIAPRDAVVAQIHVTRGSMVSSDDVLFTLR